MILGFIGGTEARMWTPRSAEDRKKACLDKLAKFFGDEAHNVEGRLREGLGRRPVGARLPRRRPAARAR